MALVLQSQSIPSLPQLQSSGSVLRTGIGVELVDWVARMLRERWFDAILLQISSRRNWVEPRLDFHGSEQKREQLNVVGGIVKRLCSDSTMSSLSFELPPGRESQKKRNSKSLRLGSNTKKTKLRDFTNMILSRLLQFVTNQNKNRAHGTSSDQWRSRHSSLYVTCKVLVGKSDVEESRVDFLAGAVHGTSLQECVSRVYALSKLLPEKFNDVETEKSECSDLHGPSDHLRCSTRTDLESYLKDVELNVIGDIPEDINGNAGKLDVLMVPSNCDSDSGCDNEGVNQAVSMQMDWYTNVDSQLQPSIHVKVPPIGDGQQSYSETDISEGDAASCLPIAESGFRLLMLAEDLQNEVFAKLPMRDVFQLRTSCRALRRLPIRESFKQARGLESDLESTYSPIFFTVHNARLEWAGYDLVLQQWSTLPTLECLPSPNPGVLKEFLVAGGDGLLCVNVAKASEDPELVVCNPLTQETRVLPQMNFPRHPVLMHLLVDRCKNSYKVIVAGSSSIATEHLCRKTEVYCSQTDSWQVCGNLPAPDFGLNEYQNGVYCDGVLYCIALADNFTSDKVVLAYHVEKGIWLTNWYCKIPKFRCKTYFATTQIVDFGGSIFVFSEQEYLKDVKFCIARLDCIEIGETKQSYYMEQRLLNSASASSSHLQNPLQQPGRHNYSSSEPAAADPDSGKQENTNLWSSLMNKHKDPKSWGWVLEEPKTGIWTSLLKEPRKGSRGLLVYPENICVAQESENKLCIFNTVERTMVIHDFQNDSHTHQIATQLRNNRKKFHTLNPIGFIFKPNFNASV